MLLDHALAHLLGASALPGIHQQPRPDLGRIERAQVLEENRFGLPFAKQENALLPRHAQNRSGSGIAS